MSSCKGGEGKGAWKSGIFVAISRISERSWIKLLDELHVNCFKDTVKDVYVPPVESEWFAPLILPGLASHVRHESIRYMHNDDF